MGEEGCFYLSQKKKKGKKSTNEKLPINLEKNVKRREGGGRLSLLMEEKKV